MKLFALIFLLLFSICSFGQQLTTEIQARRGVFTERLYLYDKWIDFITANLYSTDSLSDNGLPTAKAIADYVRLQSGNVIRNQRSASDTASFWVQGTAVMGAHANYKNALFSNYPAQLNITQRGLRHGLAIQRSSLNQGPANVELFKNAGNEFNTLQALQPGDSIGTIIFSGIAGNSATVTNAASIHGLVERTGPGYLNSGIVFNTTDSNGAYKRQMWLNGQGNLLLGDETSNEYGLNITSGHMRIGSLANGGLTLLGSDNDGVLHRIQLGENIVYKDDMLSINDKGDPDNGNFWRHWGVISQSGTNAPSEITIEGDWYQWSRVSAGVYVATNINGTFQGHYTFLKSEASDVNGNAVFTRLYRSGGNTITLVVKDANMNNTDNWEGISIEVKQFLMF